MTSSFVKVDNIKNEAILRDFFIIWTGQHPKRNNSARLLQFLNVTTSKTKRFCEASFKNGKLSAQLTASYQCVLRFFQSTCRKYCAYHEKVMPSHTKCCTCHAKSSQQTWRSDAPKCNPSQEISALTSWHLWWTCPLYCACHAKCIFEDPLQIPRLPSLLEMLQNPHVLQTFDKVHNPLRLPRESTSELPKVLRTRQFFALLTWKCASRHNGAHFFDISTSKSGPRMVCFVHFDFEMCFAPQQRALFRHRNFQKWSDPGVFCTFWLRNVLRATTACNFSFLIWPAGAAPAPLASLLFDPEPQIIGKTECFATFLPFRAPASSFFSLFLFSDLLYSTLLFSLPLPISAFHLSILSEVWLLNFLR